MHKIQVSLKTHPYSILSGAGILADAGKHLRKAGINGRCFIVSNKKVSSLYLKPLLRSLKKEKYEVFVFDSLPDSEKAKSLTELGKIYSAMLSSGLDRSSAMISLGGGIAGDVSGFAAATFMRGIAWVNIPTTLLSQVDSAIGGKTGVNLSEGKNLAGSFYQPRLVLSDSSVLESLREIEIRSALAEVIKYGVIWDSRFFKYLEKNIGRALQKEKVVLTKIVTECSKIKAHVVAQDEKELSGVRAILNFGHTFAHGIEGASAQAKKTIPHGIAVGIGMALASKLAVKKGLFAESECQRVVQLLEQAKLPTCLPSGLDVKKVLEFMQNDKKKVGKTIHFILPRRIGHVESCANVSARELKQLFLS